MIYIYDIILNFNSVFYEFYEWDSKDNLTFIRKIPLVKVDTNFINDILTKKVVIDDPIVLEITNKCEITSCKKANKIKYACLFTDSLKVIGVILNDKKQIINISDNMVKAKYLSDISFSSNDYMLNSLLTLLPRKIYIHLIDNCIDEFINTLNLIFEKRISICTNCNICNFYKNIKKVTSSTSATNKNNKIDNG